MKAVILAGGLGSRLKPFTEVIPKPLLPVGEKAVLEVQIEQLKAHGFTDVVLATNYKSEYIENFFGDGSRFGINLKVSKETKPLGTVGPLTLLKKELVRPFLVMNGDILTLMDFTKFYSFAQANPSALTVAIKKHVTPFDFGNIFFDGDFVTGVDEKKDIVSNIVAGIYIMKPEIFDLIPDDTYYGMDVLIQTMLDKKIPVAKYEMSEYWLDIGRVDDYYVAQETIREKFSNK